MQEAQATLRIGTVIGKRYIIKSLIGKGSSGAVYLVEDQQRAKHHLFALKEVIGLTSQERDRITLEGMALKQLQHPALSRVYHVFNDDKHERVYMLMEYIKGLNLETLWQQRSEERFSGSEVMTILAPIIDAIGYLHYQQPPILHRNIKPVNIIVPPTEEKAVLVDFGITKDNNVDTTPPPLRSASSGYAAPEQYSRGNDIRTDIYGIGATCYTLLTGRVPPDAFTRLAHITKGDDDPLEPVNKVISTVPAFVAEAIQRAMSLHAQNRFSSVGQFWQALRTPPTVQFAPVSRSIPASSSNLPIVTKHFERTSQQPVQRRPFSFSILLGILTVLLFLGSLGIIGIGAGFWSFPLGHSTAAPAPSTSTSASVTSPMVARTYSGTIFDVAANISTGMSLKMQRSQRAIWGSLILGPKLQRSGSFSGIITLSKQVQFTVTDSTGQAALFFEGTMQSATSLSGDYYYCRQVQRGPCRWAPGTYGVWSVALVS